LIVGLLPSVIFTAAPVQAQHEFPVARVSQNIEEYGNFGDAVARIEDLNGDNMGDLIIGAPAEDVSGKINAGRVYLISTADGTRLQTFVSPNAQDNERFGRAVASVEDIDGDQVQDVIVGADIETVNGESTAGRVYLFSGADGTLLETIESPSPEKDGFFGRDVSGAGDVDGDGAGDVLIGTSETTDGRAYLFSGSDGGLLDTLDPSSGENFGHSVSGIEDLNGDGVEDLLVSDPQRTVNGKTGAGQVFLFSGADGSIIRRLESPNLEEDGGFGEGVAGVDDLDGDGEPDILVGAVSETVEGTNFAGRVYSFSGADGSHVRTLTSPNVENAGDFGGDVAGLGDVNGNGAADILVGASGETVKSISGAGRAYLYSGGNGQLLKQFESENVEEDGNFGEGVTGVDDVDGDGIEEVAVAAPDEKAGGKTSAGRTYAFLSTEPFPPSGLAVSASPDEISLKWSVFDSVDVAKYRVYRDPALIDSSDGPSRYTALDSTTVGDTTFTDTNVTPGQTYFYRVTAVDTSGNESGFSEQASGRTPLAITGLQPESGAAGTTVRIRGTGFSPTASDNTVTFGSATATVESAKSTAIYAQVPSGVSGPVEVSVSVHDTMVTGSRRFGVVTAGTGTFVDSTGLPGATAAATAIADVDGDGDRDLLVAGDDGSSPATTLYIQQSDGSFAAANAGLTDISDGSVSIADVDGDGDQDLLIAGDAGGVGGQETILYEQQSDGSFDTADAGLTGVERAATAIADVDGNGEQDLLVAGFDPAASDTTTTLYTQSSGSFNPAGAGLTGVSDGSISIADVDGDGNQDLLIAGDAPSRDTTILYKQKSGGSFQAAGAGLTGATHAATSIADVDGDGTLDLLVAGLDVTEGFSDNIPTTTLYEQQSDGSFEAANANLTGVNHGSTSIADVDGDGDADLLVTGSSESGLGTPTTTLYEQKSDGSFEANGTDLTDVEAAASSVADVDGDGDQDLLIAGRDADTNPTTTVYRNGEDVFAPDVPPTLAATATPDSISLDWAASDSSDVAKYQVYRDTAPIDSSAGPSSYTAFDSTDAENTAFADTSVTPGETHYYRVTAVDTASNESGFSEEAQATPEDTTALSNLTVDTPVDSTFRRSSAPNDTLTVGYSYDEANPDTVTIQFADGSGNRASFGVDDGGYGGNDTTKTVRVDFSAPKATDGSGLQEGTTYDLTVRATDGSGNTKAATETGRLRIDETAPQLQTATIAADTLSLAYDEILDPDSVPPVDSFEVRVNGAVTPLDTTGVREDIATVVLDAAVSVGDSVVIEYAGGGIRDRAKNEAASLSAQTVTNETGTSTPALTITGLQPESATVGTTVRVHGTGFSSTAADNTVTFGSTEATVDSAESTLLYAQVPSGVSGPVLVTVAVGGEQATSSRAFQALAADLGERSLSPIQADLVNLSLSTSLVRWGDYDDDGDLDLLVAGNDSDAPGDENPVAKIYRNDGDGEFTDINAGLTGVWRGAAEWGDIDGDGDLDVILTGHGPGDVPTTVLYRNEGGDNFSEMSAGLPDVWSSSVDWGDYDGDGDLDLAIAGWTGNGFISSIFENDGGGRLTSIDAGLVGVENGSVRWGDWSGDGAPDLVVTGDSNGISTEGGHVAKLYENRGSETFVESDAGLTPVRQSSVDPGDYNRDGRLDLVVSGENVDADETTTIYRNDGAGSFSTIDAGVVGVRGGEVEWGDYNGDGRVDVAVSGFNEENGQITNVYINNGGSFSMANHRLAGVDGAGLDWGDYDGDGDLDLAVLGDTNGPPNEGGLLTRIYRNGGLVLPRLAASTDGSQVRLSWTSSPSSVQAYQVYRSTSSFPDTSAASRVGRVANTTFADESGLSRGQAYHYRVVPVAPDGVAGRLSEEVSVELPPQMVSSETDISFGDATDEDSYRPVALPGGDPVGLSSVMAGEAGAEGDYRAYAETGASGDQAYNVVECGVGGGECSFAPGGGLWLLARDPAAWGPPEERENVQLTSDATYSVSLNPGWNLISNPFSVDVSWSAVQAANGGSLSPLYERTQNGTWNQVSTFASATTGTGYYVKNEGSLDEMVLPHPTAADSTSTENESSSAREARAATAPRSEEGVRLGVYQNEQKRSRVELVVDAAAEARLDSLDVEAPPAPFASTVLRAVAEGEETEASLLRAARPVEQGGQRFPLQLETDGEPPVTIRADSLNLPDRYEAVLVERPVGRTHDLREGDAVLQPDTSPAELVLLVGTPSYVDEKKSEIVPERLTLLGNYPNPVSRSTTIEYALPEKRQVRLTLYDVLGRRVQVLARGQKRAGFHRVQWSGARKLASGIYFYRLQAGGETTVKKMTIVR